MSHPSHNWQEMTDNCCNPHCLANSNGPGADLPCPAPWAWPPEKGDPMLNKVDPITPSQAKVRKINAVPPQVLEAFNELITENLSGGYAIITQKEAITRIQSKINQTLGNYYSPDDICERGWLDIEDIYRKAGWKVEYDKPGFNETYEATFEFTASRK